MADEAVLIFETERAIPFTVADGAGIEKGSVLKSTDPMSAIITSGNLDVIAGIAAKEKILNDGNVKLAVFRRGIFRMKASGGITVGDPLASTGGDAVNLVKSIVTDLTASGARQIGIALETAADRDTFLMELNIQANTEVRT